MRHRDCFALVCLLGAMIGCGSSGNRSDSTQAQSQQKQTSVSQPTKAQAGKGEDAQQAATDPTRPFKFHVVVSRDPAALATARRLVEKRQDRFIEGLLNRLGEIHYFEPPTMAEVRAVSKKLIPELKRRLSAEHDVPVRLEAGVLLARLQETSGLLLLFELLSDDQQPAQILQRVLRQLVDLPRDAVLEQASHKRILLQRLSHSDRQVQVDAVEACSRLQVPGVTARLASMLADKKVARPGRVAFWLAQTRPDATTAKLVEQWLMDASYKGRRFWLADALMHIGRRARKSRPSLTAQIVGVLDRYLRRVDQLQLEIEETQVKDVAKFLGSYGDERNLAILKRVYSQKTPVDPAARSAAFLGWIRTSQRAGADPATLLADAASMLQDTHMRVGAAQAMAELLAGKEPTPEQVKLLQAAAETGAEPGQRASIAATLMRMSGKASRTAALQITRRLDPAAQMRMLWIAEGLTLEDAARELVKRKLIPDRSYTKWIAEIRRELKIQGNDADGLYQLVRRARGLVTFFRVVQEHPCRHDQLMSRFAKITGGTFLPTHFYEQLDEEGEEDEYRLRFIFAGRVYSFRARVLDELYDMEAIIHALNHAVADSGAPERFVSLTTEEQVGMFMFGDPAQIRAASKVLHFPIQEKLGSHLEESRLLEQAINQLEER